MQNIGELFVQRRQIEERMEAIAAPFKAQIADLNDQMDRATTALQDDLEAVQDQINAEVRKGIDQMRHMQEQTTGTVSFVSGGVKIKSTVPKKVAWDQGELRGVFDKIRDANDDPFEYMKVSFSVSEKDFGKYPDEIRAVFMPARTVVPGVEKISYDFEVSND